MQKALFLLINSILSLNLATGATLNGKISDANTGELLVGATILIQGTSHYAVSNLDGSYSIPNIPAGKYSVEVRYISYETQVLPLSISKDEITKVLDIKLKNAAFSIDDVVIKGSFDKESDASARNSEKNSDEVMNIISAKRIQLLPDIIVGDVLQRISGVSVERGSSGSGKYAIIRGMEQRYNYTLVNGIKIPSPDNKYRYVPMDLFPAELLERLEVVKALNANMEADAIGGAMNLVMKSAPTHFTFHFNAATGFNSLAVNQGFTQFNSKVLPANSPAEIHGPDYVATPNDFTYRNFNYSTAPLAMNQMYGFTFGNRYLKAKRLGLVIGASYQNTYRNTNSIFFQQNTQPNPGNVPAFDDIYSRKYSTKQVRYGIHSKLDYALNSRNTISLYTVYMEMDESQYRHTVDTSLSIGRTGTGTGNTYILDRSRLQKQSIYNNTLQGKHEIVKGLILDWSGVYSLAKNTFPDWAEYQTVQKVGKDSAGNKVILEPEHLNIPFQRIWWKNSDRDIAGYLNLNYTTKIFGQKLTLSAGGLYRDKHRENTYYYYEFTPKSVNGLVPPFDGVVSPDKFVFNSDNAAKGGSINPNTYKASEIIYAYYGMFKLEYKKKLDVVGGIRVESTYQAFQTVMPPSFFGKSGNISYQDILPSFNLKYKLNPKTNLRMSYYKALNRAGFFEIIPYNVQGDYYTEVGNPFLKHTVAHNMDLRYEYFPTALDQILVGVFYKHLINPIETGYIKTGTSSSALQPSNFGTAINFGLELSVIKYWKYFGISGNYTYTNSTITTNKFSYNRDENGQLTNTVVQQTRPLQGQSPQIGNLSLIYKNTALGLDMQLAMVYTGKKITQVSLYKDLDYWQKGMFTMGFSIEKSFGKKFSAYCKVQNLLNTPVTVELRTKNTYRTGRFALTDQTRDDRVLVQKEYYGQNYIFGLRWKVG
ncbi:MAG: TonB-dependent receptor plug domain-containing protein [Bacteroidetes bacterium]|nr:TonB-dependent receptor plug domain-containing protein [Bacteroidota bacterium]